MANQLPWVAQLLKNQITDPIENDSRTIPGTLLGWPQADIFNSVIGGGQADFDQPVGHLSGTDRALLYAKYNQPRHLDELFSLFADLITDSTRFNRPTLIDIGCGPFTAGLALAAVLGPERSFRYYGIDRAKSMLVLGQQLFTAAKACGGIHNASSGWFGSDLQTASFGQISGDLTIVVVSYLFASPSLDVPKLSQDLRSVLARIGLGPVAVLYTNSAKPGLNGQFASFKAQLESDNFSLIVDHAVEFSTARTPIPVRLALFFREAIATFPRSDYRTYLVTGNNTYLPKLDDLIDEQRDVYEAEPDQHLFVAGPPGSGKTTLAVWRARQLVALKRKVIIITRNKMLAVLVNQLSASACIATTMHAHVAQDYRLRCNALIPQFSPYNFEWQAVIQAYSERNIMPVYDHMIIDEGQNLPAGFFRWAIRFGARTLTVFADENQTTDSDNATLQAICEAGLPRQIRLLYNHRNTQEIALVAEHFHRSTLLPAAIVRRGRSGEKPIFIPGASWDAIIERIAMRYNLRGGSIGVIVFRKEEVIDVCARLKAKLPDSARVEYYVSGSGNETSILSHAPGITILTSESVIGLEFETVFLQDLSRSLPCDTPEKCRRMYMLCARARDSLILFNGPQALSAAQIASLPDNNLLER